MNEDEHHSHVVVGVDNNDNDRSRITDSNNNNNNNNTNGNSEYHHSPILIEAVATENHESHKPQISIVDQEEEVVVNNNNNNNDLQQQQGRRKLREELWKFYNNGQSPSQSPVHQKRIMRTSTSSSSQPNLQQQQQLLQNPLATTTMDDTMIENLHQNDDDDKEEEEDVYDDIDLLTSPQLLVSHHQQQQYHSSNRNSTEFSIQNNNTTTTLLVEHDINNSSSTNDDDDDDDEQDDIVVQLLRHQKNTSTNSNTTTMVPKDDAIKSLSTTTMVPKQQLKSSLSSATTTTTTVPSSLSIPPIQQIEYSRNNKNIKMHHQQQQEEEEEEHEQILGEIDKSSQRMSKIDEQSEILSAINHMANSFMVDPKFISNLLWIPQPTRSFTTSITNHSIIPPTPTVRNCYGIVHVRVLRIQRLSCPVHSNISLIYKLYPWKGKVRSSDKMKITTFVIPSLSTSNNDVTDNTMGKGIDTTSSVNNKIDSNTNQHVAMMDHGVCAQWVDDPNMNPNYDESDNYTVNNNNGMIKMLHAYSDPISSPIPTIMIDVLFNPIPFIEFTMCTFTIDCTYLFQYPNRIHKQWFYASTLKNTTTSIVNKESNYEQGEAQYDVYTSNDPMIEIEAMFEPAATEQEQEHEKYQRQLQLGTPVGTAEAVIQSSTLDATAPPGELHHSNNSLLNKALPQQQQQPLDSNRTGHEISSSSIIMKPTSSSLHETMENSASRMIHGKQLKNFGEGEASDENDLDDNDDISTTEQSKITIASATAVLPSQQHLLQISHYRFTPAFCCTCGKSLLSLQYPIPRLPSLWYSSNKLSAERQQTITESWKCERCNVDCCDDCRLQVDILLPCGSESAMVAVSNALQNKLTMEKILNAVAPPTTPSTVIENKYSFFGTTHPSQFSVDSSERAAGGILDSSVANKYPTINGIGRLKLCLQRVHILKDPLPPETDPVIIVNQIYPHLRAGDYYIRINWSGGGNQIVTIGDIDQNLSSVRTRTMQRSSGQLNFSFDNETMQFIVPHYGMEYRIDVVDATTDRTIGTGLITAQGILQQQRDYLIEEKRLPFLSFVRQPIRFSEMRRIVLELRAGLKTGFSGDFYTQSKSLSSTLEGDVHSGDVVGCIELATCLEENYEGLFGQNPYECPPRPTEDLNMAVFQLHLQRISNILDDFKQIFELYRHVVSWKDPLLTLISFLMFLRLSIWFDPAYTGSVPVFLLVLAMSYLAAKRVYGKMKDKYIQKEILKNRKAENSIVNYDIHRPVGQVRIKIVKGRNIRSPELGLAGNVCCKVYLDLTRFMKERDKKKALELDHSMNAPHEFGSTTFAFGTDPAWDGMISSDRAMRMKLLLPQQGTFFEDSDEQDSIAFPILQPISSKGDLQVLDPWETSCAAIVVEVRLTDLLNVIPGSEYTLGEVVLPFRDLVVSGEIRGWYKLEGAHSTSSTSLPEASKTDDPQLYLSVIWQSPPNNSSISFLEMEKEASYAIQEEMIRSAMLTRSQKEKVNLLVSSIGALNSVRGISTNLQTVQNQLGWTLDLIESCIHLIDFTDPFKSSFILALLCALWLFLSIVSTRLIVIALGLVQYSMTLKLRIDHWRRGGLSDKPSSMVDVTSSNEGATSSPHIKWIMNAIRGLPTSEDLRKTYFWESRRLGTIESKSLSVEKRKSRMRRLWRVQWYGVVRMLVQSKKAESSEWRNVFVLVQGHRLLWWRSLEDFDNGFPPIGKLLLAGHAGLSNPSPLELREIEPDEVNRAVCIFGNGARATMIVTSVESKRDLDQAIEDALASKND